MWELLHQGISLAELFWGNVQETSQTASPEVIRELAHKGDISPVEDGDWLMSLNRIALGECGIDFLLNFWPVLLGACAEEIHETPTHKKTAFCSWASTGR